MMDLKKVEDSAKRIYEDSFDLSLLQEDLESKLDEIYENNLEFERGKLSKTSFKENEKVLKKSSIRMIKNIKSIISSNLKLLDTIRNELKPTKPKRKLERIKPKAKKKTKVKKRPKRKTRKTKKRRK